MIPDLLDIIDLFFFPPPAAATTAAGGDVLMLVRPERGGSGATMMTDQETLVAPLNPTAIAQLSACSSL